MRSTDDLHDYQRDAVRFFLDHPKSSGFLDVGMGKTAITLTVLDQVLRPLDSGQALVIAPIRVAKQTWPTEISQWSQASWIDHALIRAEDSDDDVKDVFDYYRTLFMNNAVALDVPVRHRSRWAARFAGEYRERFKQDKRRRLADSKVPLHIIGLPQVEWLVAHHGKQWPYKTVIVDESSAFKEFSTKRWKALNSVYRYIDRMHLLTASPAAESWLGVWAQIGLLDRGERLGRRITHYRETYFNHDPYTYSYELKSGAREAITAKIGDICLVMKAEDHLDLKKPLMLTRPVTLGSQAIRMYDDFVANFVLSLPEAEIEAVSGGVLINKLLQFTGGSVLDEEKRLHEVHDDKIDELRELVDEIQGTPVMVAYWYKSSLTRLKKAFPQATVMDKGGKCVEAWNRNEIPMLLIQAASASHGLNMQYGDAQDIVWFDVPWSREYYDQLIGRLARQGQRKVVRVHHLIVKREDDGVKRSKRDTEERMTADEIVMQALHDKGEGQATLFRLIRALRDRVVAGQTVGKAVKRDDSNEGDDL